MINRFRVLGGMLALEEFTAQDLASYSGVKVETVRTVLHRERARLIDVRTKPTGKPGGQLLVHGLKPGESERIRLELEELFSRLPDPSQDDLALDSPDAESELPLALLTAENALLEHLGLASSSQERGEILRVAKSAIRSAERQLNRLPAQGRRREDQRYRGRLEQLADILLQIETGALAVDEVPGQLEEVLTARPLFRFKMIEWAKQPVVYFVHFGEFARTEQGEQTEVLAERIRRAVRSIGVELQEPPGEAASALMAAVRGAAVVMLDSSLGRSRILRRSLFQLAPDRTMVFDMDSDDTLRNEMLRRQSWYQPNAASLDEAALAGALTRLCVNAWRDSP